MYTVVGRCPICSDELVVSRLRCPNCDVTLEGQFALGRFYRLTSEQLRFLETFIRCEGKITRVAEELKLSYPTVRARLLEIIRTLGYEPREDPQRPVQQRQTVLNDLQEGKISVDEALRLLGNGS